MFHALQVKVLPANPLDFLADSGSEIEEQWKQGDTELKFNEALEILREARHVIQSYTSQSIEFIDNFLAR